MIVQAIPKTNPGGVHGACWRFVYHVFEPGLEPIKIPPKYKPPKFSSKNIKNKIVVVDDCSSVKSRLILRYIEKKFKDIEVYRNLKNLGQGGAIKNGIKNSKIFYSSKICTIDDDGQHHVDDVKKILYFK